MLHQHLPLAVRMLSSNDPFVPSPFTLKLSIVIQGWNTEGKIQDFYGFIMFPELLDILNQLMKMF